MPGFPGIFPFPMFGTLLGGGGGIVGTGPNVPTDPGAILLALQYNLQQSGLFTGSAGIALQKVVVTQIREPFPYLGNTVYLFCGAQNPQKDVINGTGRFANLYRGDFIARFIHVNMRDFPYLETRGLTNPFVQGEGDVGMMPFATQLANVLNDSFLVDVNSNFLSCEPMEAATIGMPSYYGEDLAYDGVDLNFSVLYRLNVVLNANE